MSITPDTQRRTVLLIEDNPALSDAARLILEQAGIGVTLLDDGLKAEAYIATHEPPDVVALDILLPQRDGYELLQQIRAHPRWKLVKVLMLTSLDTTQDVRRARKLGADDYLFKPVEPAILLRHVLRLANAP